MALVEEEHLLLVKVDQHSYAVWHEDSRKPILNHLAERD